MSTSLWNDEQERPIQHLRVVDMTVMVPGPYLTRMLAQYGADVIKVEVLPKGDPMRHLEQTAVFDFLNQGKRSVAINLQKDEGVELVQQLAAEADVFVESFREGVMDGYGLGYAELSEVNPDLLYLSLRGFGGKDSGHAGHDLNFVANSGCGEWFLEGGHPNYSTQFGDMVAGVFMPCLKLMFHLSNPARRGMHLVSNMDESFRALYLPRAYDTVRADTLPESKRKKFGLSQMLDGSQPHSRYYRCRDAQWIALNAVQEKHWHTFCEVVDRPNWKPRLNDVKLVPELEKLFLDAPASYWEALVGNREACLFRVIPWAEHLAGTSARAQLSADPLSWAGFAPNPNATGAPIFGADTFTILHSMGVSNKAISDWMSAGVVFQADSPSNPAASSSP